MAALDVKVKRYIVQALACFDTPSQVVAAVKEEFGLDVSRQQVATYDPTKVNGRLLSKDLRALFTETRAKFRAEVEEIPIAQQSFRLRSLSRMHQRAEASGNAPLAAQLLEQAAKEIGGAYTDRRRIVGEGPGGSIPLQHGGQLQHQHVHNMAEADLERIAASGGA
jgi:hypothetical protein